MAINPEQISKITTEAYSSLKNKALGGVSKDSAQSAIDAAVKKAVQLGEEAIGRIQQEMQALQGKTAREIHNQVRGLLPWPAATADAWAAW